MIVPAVDAGISAVFAGVPAPAEIPSPADITAYADALLLLDISAAMQPCSYSAPAALRVWASM